MFGWIGTILRINLSAKTCAAQPLEDRVRLHFLGGRGINSSLLYQEVPPRCDALSPDNSIILGSSPLTGTATPSAARCTITAKHP